MDIFDASQKISDYVIACRRQICQNPELSDKEFATLAFIRAQLDDLGIAYVSIEGGGIIATIEGPTPGKTVLLRADMDALALQEDPCNFKTQKTCLSSVPGVAHLCGHDAHVAMLLGAGKLLQENKNLLQGKVLLFFEQGEECGHGDIHMFDYIQTNDLPIDGCWALHVFPQLDKGYIGLIPGGVFAGAVSWGITLKPKGKGNVIDCGASILQAIQSARLSAVSPFEAITLTPCIFRTNPDGTCLVRGSCRFYERDKAGLPMKRAIRRIAEETCKAYDCEIVDMRLNGPKEGLLNDPTCYEIAKEALTQALGSQAVVAIEPTMYGESFSALSSYYPSLMVLLGIRDAEKGITATLHNPKFEANEEALCYGVAASVAYAIAFLNHKQDIPFTPFVGSFDDFRAARQMD